MKRTTSLLLTLILVMGIGTGGSALELGLTPNHVYNVWTNINNVIVKIAEKKSSGATYGTISNMEPKNFTGKIPGDVLKEVIQFRGKLDILKKQYNLKTTDKKDVANGEKITPSHVFLNSGFVLDSSAELLITITNKDTLISPFYKNREISGKPPSNVFQMVDLATRRLDLILTN